MGMFQLAGEVWTFGGRSGLEIPRAGLTLAHVDLSGGLRGQHTPVCLPKAWDLSSPTPAVLFCLQTKTPLGCAEGG